MSLTSRSLLLKLTFVGALVFGMVLAPAAARAQAIFTGDLDGASVNPPNASPGTGAAEVGNLGNLLTVDLSFSALVAPATAAHIHCCAAPPATVGVAVTLTGFPTGVTSGIYSNFFDLLLPVTYQASFLTLHGGAVEEARAALLAGLNDGQAYICVHSTVFPGAEIRSFLDWVSFSHNFEAAEPLGWSVVVP